MLEVWRSWAEHLLLRLEADPPLDPPLLGDDTTSLQANLCELRSAAPQRSSNWWRAPPVADAIAAALEEKNFAVIDGFMGEAAAAKLRTIAAAAEMKPARQPGAPAASTQGTGSAGIRPALSH